MPAIYAEAVIGVSGGVWILLSRLGGSEVRDVWLFGAGSGVRPNENCMKCKWNDITSRWCCNGNESREYQSFSPAMSCHRPALVSNVAAPAGAI